MGSLYYNNRNNEEIRYKLLKLLEKHPDMTQRQLAAAMGVSLGKVNYCLKGLVEKGAIKINRFKNSHRKLAYRYLLTPEGLKEKTIQAARFLKRKITEYEFLKEEIEALRSEIDKESSYNEQPSE